jgi:hypothetical protein
VRLRPRITHLAAVMVYQQAVLTEVQVFVESPEGVGSRFAVRLPIAAPTAKTAAASSRDAA